jgi:hypothetical protein
MFQVHFEEPECNGKWKIKSEEREILEARMSE